MRLEGKIDEPEINLNIEAGNGSNVRIVLLQNISDSRELRLRITCNLHEHSRIDFIQIHLGGAEINAEIIQVAKEPFSELNTYLMSLTKKKQIHNFNLTNSYNSQLGRGRIVAKGAALDESKLSVKGAIQISRKGTGTDAHLKQDCLLLGKKAKINSTPILKIDTDNVKAGHGASISNINDESLYYLTSRGISPDEARKMLITGFMAEVMDEVKDTEIYEYIQTNL